MQDVLNLLVNEGLIEEARASEVQAVVDVGGLPLAEALRTKGAVSEEKVLRFLAAYYGLNYVDMDQCTPPKELIARFPAGMLLKHRLLPLAEHADGFAEVATCDPFDGAPLDRLRIATGLELRPALAPAADI